MGIDIFSVKEVDAARRSVAKNFNSNNVVMQIGR